MHARDSLEIATYFPNASSVLLLQSCLAFVMVLFGLAAEQSVSGIMQQEMPQQTLLTACFVWRAMTARVRHWSVGPAGRHRTHCFVLLSQQATHDAV